MCAFNKDDELEDEFEARVEQQRRRIEKGRAEKEGSFFNYLGLFGVVGWSVVIPLLIGVFVGMWMDDRFKTGYVWSLGLLLLGLVVGCVNAWRIITKEL